jgi:hypothetical protein
MRMTIIDSMDAPQQNTWPRDDNTVALKTPRTTNYDVDEE